MQSSKDKKNQDIIWSSIKRLSNKHLTHIANRVSKLGAAETITRIRQPYLGMIKYAMIISNMHPDDHMN